MLTLKVVRRDPHFGFVLNGDYDKDIYQKIADKGYQCLTPYVKSKVPMTVVCPAGHSWSGLSRVIIIPCNNCKKCWDTQKVTPENRISQIITARGGKQISAYVNCRESMKLQCAEGHTFELTPNSIKTGGWCPFHKGIKINIAEQKFIAMVAARGGQQLSPYVKSTTKVQIQCAEGHVFEQAPSSTIQGAWCRMCAGNDPSLGEANLRRAVDEKGGIVLGPYVNNHTKISLQCANGHLFNPLPADITRGQWCAKCSNKCSEQAEARFRTRVHEQGGQIAGPYVNNKTKVEILCAEGHTFQITPGHISSGEWCTRCRNHCPIQAEERFRAEVQRRGGIILGPYVNTATSVELQCQDQHKFWAKPNNVMNDKWCRPCGLSESKGERAIREYLADYGIDYQQEVEFPWSNRKRYDFVVHHNLRHYIIEYDGIQHFEQIEFFCPDIDEFVKRQQIDIVKTVAALTSGYYVIRICYSDLNDIDILLASMLHDDPSHTLLVSDHEMYSWLTTVVW